MRALALAAFLLPGVCWAADDCADPRAKALLQCFPGRIAELDDRVSQATIVASAVVSECVREIGAGPKPASFYAEVCVMPLVLRSRVNRAR